MPLETKGLVINLGEEVMGGSSKFIEPYKIEDCVMDSEVAWVYLREGGLYPYMECIEGFDEQVSM